MSNPLKKAERKEIVRSYFEKIDNKELDSSYLALFTDDVEFYFPKFGLAKGKDKILEFGDRIGGFLQSIRHDINNFNYIITDDYVVVEGREGGITREGKIWPDGKISQGLFCNVFEFEANRIKRVHIYVDPDFTSEDTERIKIFSTKQE